MKRRTKIVVGSMVALAVVGAAAFAVIRSRGPQGVRVKTSKVDKKEMMGASRVPVIWLVNGQT